MKSDQAGRHFSLIHAADTPLAEAKNHCRKLEELLGRLNEINVFSKGQLVKWKPGLKNRRFPEYGEPAIVTEVLSVPIFDPSEASAGSPYFQEPLTIVVGMHREEDFVEFRLDGRRFEPFDL